MLAARFQGRERERAEGSPEFAPRKLNTIREERERADAIFSMLYHASRSLLSNKEGL